MSADDPAPSITDPLTGAYSRALLAPRLAEELSRAARAPVGCALYVFDVDYFKSINDAYGHPRGDEVLRLLCERIHNLVRAYDVLFRYGGDEFVLLLPDTSRADAVRVALRLVDGIKGTPFPGEPPLSVSISLGVASFPDDASDAESLLAVADRRNYLAKHRGRACAVADDAESDSRPVSSRLLERDLPLGATREFLTRLIAGERGALRMTGEPGAGFTRFVEEVGRAGRLRGFSVVTAGEPVPDTDQPLLVLADAAGPVTLPDRPGVGLVCRDPGDVPVLDTVELLPWSAAAVRVWLRTTLQAEPSRVLVDWLMERTGGLPARVAGELSRLTDTGGLVRADDGWTVAPALLHRASRRFPPLPAALTELVGRQQETAQVAAMLAERRLVTLTGAGGIGKTRLSLAVASALVDSYADGAVFVPLDEAHSAEQVLTAIARAVDATVQPGQSILDAVTAALADRAALVVLDNFEQAHEAAPTLAELLAAAPAVRMLVSSRAKLGLYGEQVYRVPPLALPEPGAAGGVAAALATSPALALFAARARAAAYDFAVTEENLATVADLCRHLDGLPLAIELAAAHADELTPAQMLAQLGDRLDLPGPAPLGVPVRQQTLRGAIDWSYTLLGPEDAELFVRLGAFRGGATRAAIEAVCPDVTELDKRLACLVDRSLVRAEPNPADGVRYVLLETIRSYAAERLGDAPAVRARHAGYYAGLAERTGRELTGPEQAWWAGCADREYPNLSLVLDGPDAAAAARVALGLWRFWRGGARLHEGRRRLSTLLAASVAGEVRAPLLHAAAVLAGAQDDHATAGTLAAESLALAETVGDRRTAAQAGNALGIAALAAGDYDAAHGHFAGSLATWRELAEPFGMAMAHGNLTIVSLRRGDLDAASSHAAQSLDLERAQGNARGIMLGLLCRGEINLLRGEPSDAGLAEALDLARSIGDLFGEAMARHLMGLAAQARGDRAAATGHVAAALSMRHDVGDRDDLAVSLDALAVLLADRYPGTATRLLAAAQALRVRHRLPVAGDADRDEVAAGLREALGPDAFELAWETGQSAGLDAVIEEALEKAAQRRVVT